MARQRPASLPSVPSPEQLARERKVLELRQAGVPFDRIAEQVGYTNRGSAYRAYRRALARVHYPLVTEARELELSRLDRLQAAHWVNALKGDKDATASVLRIIDTRIRLLGLSAADGIAEREARINEMQAALLAETVKSVINDLPLTAEQRTDALRLIATRVAGITRDDEAVVPHDEDDPAAIDPPPATTDPEE